MQLAVHVWYDDGPPRAVRSVDEWDALPGTGVLWVTLYRPTGRTFLNGGDWYYLSGGEVRYTPSVGWDSYVPKPCATAKRGDAVPDDVFRRVAQRAWETSWH